ncbi:MAG: hypothetical protein IH624_16360 [Phycisphaerae bacterium]|nr:hypothetical protein [Phycisphaerae bacterium]
MSKRSSKASLSKGRAGWCTIFYHPVARTDSGKSRRVRRGLGTKDEAHAQTLVDQLNQLIDDPAMHAPASRERAAVNFDPVVVSAFFDPLQLDAHDGWAIRDETMPLPGGKDVGDGYARAQFIGTTGAGKTTVVRQMIGTDPQTERFPSISAAKTTICDIEVIMRPGDFEAVVTFIPRDRVRQYIAECVLAAVASKLEGAPERDVVRHFLEHNEQRFRLSYILGNPLTLGAAEDDDDEMEEEYDEAGEGGIPEEEKARLLEVMNEYLRRIGELAEDARIVLGRFAAEFGIKVAEASKQDREVLQELVEDHLAEEETFHNLVDVILENVESRFDLEVGEIMHGKDNWPLKWSLKSKDRTGFLKVVNRFSSNYALHFGKLLTPLVDGIRVAGPFRPAWHEDGCPKLVLMDGQGIGHTADSTSSLSTSVTRRFRLADAIILVDNAAQPMQAAPCAVLRTVVSSGHESKLILAFTHFDEVKGDNLAGRASRKDHVLSSFENAVHAVGKELGREAEVALRRLLSEKIVFLAGVQDRLDPGRRGDVRFTVGELRRLLRAAEDTITPAGPITYTPFYHVANLVLAVQRATESFQNREALITRPEHWTRVKALTRRLGMFPDQDEYGKLQPVADFIDSLQKELYKFLAEPVAWQPRTPREDDEARARVIAQIRQEINTRLHELGRKRIKDERVPEWIKAFSRRGPGSGNARKDDVLGQYSVAAPTPSNEVWSIVLRDASADSSFHITPDEDAKFLLDMCNLIAKAVDTGGGVLRGWAGAPEAEEGAPE